MLTNVRINWDLKILALRSSISIQNTMQHIFLQTVSPDIERPGALLFVERDVSTLRALGRSPPSLTFTHAALTTD
jgi:hypothetical protein